MAAGASDGVLQRGQYVPHGHYQPWRHGAIAAEPKFYGSLLPLRKAASLRLSAVVCLPGTVPCVRRSGFYLATTGRPVDAALTLDEIIHFRSSQVQTGGRVLRNKFAWCTVVFRES